MLVSARRHQLHSEINRQFRRGATRGATATLLGGASSGLFDVEMSSGVPSERGSFDDSNPTGLRSVFVGGNPAYKDEYSVYSTDKAMPRLRAVDYVVFPEAYRDPAELQAAKRIIERVGATPITYFVGQYWESYETNWKDRMSFKPICLSAHFRPRHACGAKATLNTPMGARAYEAGLAYLRAAAKRPPPSLAHLLPPDLRRMGAPGGVGQGGSAAFDPVTGGIPAGKEDLVLVDVDGQGQFEAHKLALEPLRGGRAVRVVKLEGFTAVQMLENYRKAKVLVDACVCSASAGSTDSSIRACASSVDSPLFVRSLLDAQVCPRAGAREF